jgi:hypothetical protein
MSYSGASPSLLPVPAWRWLLLVLGISCLASTAANAAAERPTRAPDFDTIIVMPGSAVTVATPDGRILFERAGSSSRAGSTRIMFAGGSGLLVREDSGRVLFHRAPVPGYVAPTRPRTNEQVTAAYLAGSNRPRTKQHRIVARVPPANVVAQYQQLFDACQQLGSARCVLSEFSLRSGVTVSARADLTLWVMPSDADQLIRSVQRAIANSGGVTIYDDAIHRLAHRVASKTRGGIAALEERIETAAAEARPELQIELGRMRQQLAHYEATPPRTQLLVTLLGRRPAAPTRWLDYLWPIGAILGIASLAVIVVATRRAKKPTRAQTTK